MKRVLLTGMSGTGKSTLIKELAAPGYKAVDADQDGFSEVVSVPLDEVTGLDPGHDWVWGEDRIRGLLASDDADVLSSPGVRRIRGRSITSSTTSFCSARPRT